MLTDLTSVTEPHFPLLSQMAILHTFWKSLSSGVGYSSAAETGPGAQGTCHMGNWPPLPPPWRLAERTKLKEMDPLYHSLGLGFHLRRDESLVVKLQLKPDGCSHEFVRSGLRMACLDRKWPDRMECLTGSGLRGWHARNKAKRVLPDIRSADGEILIFCLDSVTN